MFRAINVHAKIALHLVYHPLMTIMDQSIPTVTIPKAIHEIWTVYFERYVLTFWKRYFIVRRMMVQIIISFIMRSSIILCFENYVLCIIDVSFYISMWRTMCIVQFGTLVRQLPEIIRTSVVIWLTTPVNACFRMYLRRGKSYNLTSDE